MLYPEQGTSYANRWSPILWHNRIRWYNPRLDDFERRTVPVSDDEALSLLDGSLHSPRCKQTYLEWRNLGAPIASALMRAGEAARDERDEKDDGAR
jgi:hypothetical protein